MVSLNFTIKRSLFQCKIEHMTDNAIRMMLCINHILNLVVGPIPFKVKSQDAS